MFLRLSLTAAAMLSLALLATDHGAVVCASAVAWGLAFYAFHEHLVDAYGDDGKAAVTAIASCVAIVAVARLVGGDAAASTTAAAVFLAFVLRAFLPEALERRQARQFQGDLRRSS